MLAPNYFSLAVKHDLYLWVKFLAIATLLQYKVENITKLAQID